MSKPLSASELKSLIEKSITSYKIFLDTLTSDPTNKAALKKAGLISYWMFDYTRMLRHEEIFDSSKLLKYRRGDVLSVNFGYRLGSELGGRHFAVVVDNNNNIKSDTVTVLPLTSKKAGYRDTYFTYELQHGLFELHDTKLQNMLLECKSCLRSIEEKREQLINVSTVEQFDTIKQQLVVLGKKMQETDTLKKALEKLKEGTIVQIGQITTISKLRILNPKKASDSLNKIRLHIDDLDKINTKMKDLYLFER